MITSPYEKYRQSSVQTATPGQLVLMLYDGAIRFIRVAMQGNESQDIEKANLHFGKAQTIVSELMSSLDMSIDISKNLYSLYQYTNHLLIEANVKKDNAKAEEALGYLLELRETWVQASRIAASPTASGSEIGQGVV